MVGGGGIVFYKQFLATARKAQNSLGICPILMRAFTVLLHNQ